MIRSTTEALLPNRTFLAHYKSVLKEKPDLADIREPLGIFFPRVDMYISLLSAISQVSIEEILDNSFRGGLKDYMIIANKYGYINRFGGTVLPNAFILNFPASGSSLLWIPKNSCTTLKRKFISMEPAERNIKIKSNAFHETVQDEYGVKFLQFGREKIFPLVGVIREPFERLASCYLDKFVKPVIDNRPFESFIRTMLDSERFSKMEYGRRLITFREFVKFIIDSPAWSLDAHWRPQSHFLGKNLGSVRLFRNSDLDRLWAWIGIGGGTERANSSFGKVFTMSSVSNSETFSNRSPELYRGCVIEDYAQLYDDDLIGVVHELYKEDFNIYERILS